MQLIVNGDDLGYSPAVNQAIFSLNEAGKLNSASLVVNLPFAQQAMERVRERVGLAAGIHLNLTKGRPCLPPEQIRTLVCRDGAFHSSPPFFARAAAGMIDRQQVKAELGAQIERALSGGIQIDHLDSHSHWHVIPQLSGILIELAETYGVSRVRVGELRRTLAPNRLLMALAKKTMRPAGEPAQTDYMLSLHQWLDKEGAISPLFGGEQMQGLLKRPGVSIELVVHAGSAADPDFPPDTLPAGRRQWEVNFLQSATFDDWLEMMQGVLK
ncbi:MAG: ChbG/HpnK family deacetylase [Anaerolineales bacterium]|nr:ChbG/HpnK family deacetylase [Anaerolineales bacterium]